MYTLCMNSEIPNRFYRVSVKGLILDETRTKFLVVQEENGKWELPGGGLDWGELPEDALKREIWEEMKLTTTFIALQPCYFLTFQKNNNDIHVANILYEVEVEDLDFTSSEECVAFQFVSPDEAKALNSCGNIQVLAKLFDPMNHQR